MDPIRFRGSMLLLGDKGQNFASSSSPPLVSQKQKTLPAEHITGKMDLILNECLKSPDPDPSTVFFENFPGPEDFLAIQNAKDDHDHLLQLIASAAVVWRMYYLGLRSSDPDFNEIMEYLLRHTDPGVNEKSLIAKSGELLDPMMAALGLLALKKCRESTRFPTVTRKDRILAYLIWRLRGAKDEESPFRSDHLRQTSDRQRGHGAAPSDSHRCLSANYFNTSADSCDDNKPVYLHSARRVFTAGWQAFWALGSKSASPPAHQVHDIHCQQLRSLQRATFIFTKLFLEVSKHSQDDECESIYESNGMLVIKASADCSRPLYSGSRVLQTVRRDRFVSEDQELMFLSNFRCRDVLFAGRHLFELLVRPLCTLVEEVDIVPKNMHKTTQLINSFDDDSVLFTAMYRHTVVRVTLSSGMQFALDPTGGQYGWQDFICPWPLYKERRIQYIHGLQAVEPLDSEARIAEMMKGKKQDGDINHLIQIYRRMMGSAISRVVDMCLQNDMRTNVDDFLCLPDAEFEPAEKALFKHATAFLEAYVHKGEPHWAHKLFFGPDGKVFTTQTPEAYECLKEVWFTEKEYEQLKHDGMLSEVYKARFKAECELLWKGRRVF